MAMEPITGVGSAVSPAAGQPPEPTGQAVAPAIVAPPQATLSPEQVRQAVREIQRAVGPVAQDLQFSIDKETGKTVITVVDGATKEMIRQIPSEELMAIAHALDRLQGLLLKQKA